jgi:hypothetical protein
MATIRATRPVRQNLIGVLREWFVKRGFLYLLLSAPMISMFPGYFFRWTSLAAATAYTVIVAFVVLPAWVLYRKAHSQDPSEPVHYLPRYALWALVPYVVYDLARVLANLVVGAVYWDRYYDYGAAFTGTPGNQWNNLVMGTLMHAVQGYTLALGFYVLYKRHTLLNALAYVWVMLSTIYITVYPTYIYTNLQLPARWFFVVWWSHFCMAITAWAVPKTLYSEWFLGRLRTLTAKTVVAVVIIPIYLAPFAFVFWRAETWQFPVQRKIDTAAFDRVRLVLDGSAVPVSGPWQLPGGGPNEAHYQFALRFGPRLYKDYIEATKAVDAGPVQVTGHLLRGSQVVAWCASYLPVLETPNTLTDRKEYFAALKRMEYTHLRVDCLGPTQAGQGGAPGSLQVQWSAKVTLVGDRELQMRIYHGQASAPGS